jgi:formylglycine-generating enzyme required for sulfatase activity
MHRERSGRRTPVVVLATLALAVLVAQVAIAGGPSGSGGSNATASAVSSAKFKKLKKQVAALQAQVDQLARQPGPQGPQGPAGTAPACQGNGSGDTMVSAGAVCIDRYEVSVWSSPTGGTQYGATTDDYPCNDNGQDCTSIYARSVPGVTPSRFITWFQAQQALANSGKRLPANAEWQQAVAGTPDAGPDNGTTDCKTAGAASPVATGSRSGCVSRFGANDMVGNLTEWVADWVPASTACPGWGAFSDDEMCLSGASIAETGPGALLRGGFFNDGTFAGSFNVHSGFQPSDSSANQGFRGAR